MTAAVGLHDELFDAAERVRWRMIDIPWGEIRDDLASPMLRYTVRAALGQELPTYRATQHYMDRYGDDAEFSQWVSIWFYEETKHPQALRRWLTALGERVDGDEIVGGREAYPLPRSFAGSMAVSIISEMTAAKLYLLLGRLSPEPVLQLIARNLASDESRHASGFYRFAARTLETSDRPGRVTRQILTVLNHWLKSPSLIQHPVGYFSAFIAVDDARDEVVAFEARVCRLFGQLLGLTIESPEDVASALRASRQPAGAGIR